MAIAWLLTCLLPPGASAQRSSGAGGRPSDAEVRPPDAEPRRPDLPVTHFQLANGMRFVVLPRPGAPTAAFAVRYGVGGVDDPEGQSGMAHLLEHLFFKGTTSIGTSAWPAERYFLERMDAVEDSLGQPGAAEELAARLDALEDSARTFVVPNEFVDILTRNGARSLNATTDADATTYFVELPANRVELWFALEAARLSDPVFREFRAERDVVLEERRLRVEDRPDGRLEEALLVEAFRVHPYGVPVVGRAADVRALTRGDVAEYRRRYYGANNAVVAVVGDVDGAVVRALAERYLAAVPAGDEPPRVTAVEPRQVTPRRVHVTYDAEPRIRMAWHTVEAGHPDAAPLAVLASILTGGVTSRLYRRLVVAEGTAVDVAAGGGPGGRFPGLLTIFATPRAPAGMAELEAAILDEVARLATDPPTERELATVRNGIALGEVERLASNLGLALSLAESEMRFGDWSRTFDAALAARAVTAADVVRVARTYLRPDAVTVATLGRSEPTAEGGP
jgi:predicted Zn-dependent peptidase